MHQYNFEKLEIYQNAKLLVLEIYKVTNHFPSSEIYGLTNQLRRASVSVGSNIAEGSGRTNIKEYGHFLQIAYGRCMEMLFQLSVAKELGYLFQEEEIKIRNIIQSLTPKIAALRKTILSKKLNANP